MQRIKENRRESRDKNAREWHLTADACANTTTTTAARQLRLATLAHHPSCVHCNENILIFLLFL